MATAIRGAIIQAKMSVVPVRRGYWGNKIGKPHTVPTKVLPYSSGKLTFSFHMPPMSLCRPSLWVACRLISRWQGQGVGLCGFHCK